MNKYYLSIIIPIFNNSKYILTCLRSVFKGSLFPLEIMLVDDGSTDGSLRKCKNYIKKIIHHHKIIYVKQKNSGPGFARNIGIEKATCKYITFLDSDDILLGDYFESIANLVKAESHDIIEFGFKRFSNISDFDKFKYLYSFQNSCKFSNIKNELFAMTVWYPSIRIYKKELWNGVRFNNSLYEDDMTIPRVMIKAKKIFFIKKALMGYRYNPNGRTSKITKKHFDDLFSIINKISNVIPEKNLVNIFIIRSLRTLSYFKHYLILNSKEIQNIKKVLVSIKVKKQVLNKLKLVDRIYYLYFSFYEKINFLRLFLKVK